MIFFMDQCSFSVRSEWRHLERSINELEEVKRVLSYLLTEKSHVQKKPGKINSYVMTKKNETIYYQNRR